MTTQPQTGSPAVESLTPASVWRFFAAMAAVPRPSKFEAKIQAHMRQTAAELGFECRSDSVGNIVIDVPATSGFENAPITVLQGHLDMVGEKNTGVEHDFENDPITLVIDTDASSGEAIVRADGTTLGADNGIGVAMALAAAVDDDVVHGPLEILCTADEEMGMTGAKVLTPEFIKGRRLLNLDSEEDDAIYIGCAGGADVELTWEYPTEALPGDWDACRVTVSGLRGGHSGGDIHLNRGNAIKLVIQTLASNIETPLRLSELDGGSKRNAIPREASAVVAGPAGTVDLLRSAAAQVQARAIRANGEASCTIGVEPISDATTAASIDDTKQIIIGLLALPSGVFAVVPEIAGLVQTSSNLSTIATEKSGGGMRIEAGCLTRSSSADDIQTAVMQLRSVGELSGAAVSVGNDYPGWAPDVNSPTLAVCRRLYEEMFGAEPLVTAIHAGLECGLIGERIGKIDMVSIGPRITGAHSPDECVYIASVEKSYDYLKAVLAELAKG